MTAEGVEFSAADENELGDTEGGGAPGECPHVVPFGYVVNHHIALHPHFPLHRDFSLSRRLESMSHNNTPPNDAVYRHRVFILWPNNPFSRNM